MHGHRQICQYPIADINECHTGQYECEEICANNIGSYECACNPGNVLGADGLSCEGMLTAFYYALFINGCVVCVILVCTYLTCTYIPTRMLFVGLCTVVYILWLCMVVYGYVRWLYNSMVVYGYVWWLRIYVWLCMAVCGCIWLCIDAYNIRIMLLRKYSMYILDIICMYGPEIQKYYTQYNNTY